MVDTSIIVMGDICPHDGFPNQFLTGESANVFHDLLSFLSDADYVVANLEDPATARTEKLKKNSVCLKARPDDISLLKSAGIDAVALANNHILDYQVAGLEDTLSCLQQNGIANYGAGTVEEAAEPLIVNIQGKKIGFLAFAEREFNCAIDYGKGANLWDDLDGPAVIRKAKEQCDFLVVQYHGGIEHYIYPSPYLQRKCRAMAEAGADFVACQHSHCIGTHEFWAGGEILYGQGNTIFGYVPGKTAWNQGLVAKIAIGDSVSIQYIPIEAKSDGEYLMQPDDAAALLKTFEVNSKQLSNTEYIQNSWNAFCQKQKDMYLPMLFSWGRIANKMNRMTKGGLVRFLTTESERRTSMNLLRCDAHREVLQTVLKERN